MSPNNANSRNGESLASGKGACVGGKVVSSEKALVMALFLAQVFSVDFINQCTESCSTAAL